jgi:hypothetical protein
MGNTFSLIGETSLPEKGISTGWMRGLLKGESLDIPWIGPVSVAANSSDSRFFVPIPAI